MPLTTLRLGLVGVVDAGDAPSRTSSASDSNIRYGLIALAP